MVVPTDQKPWYKGAPKAGRKMTFRYGEGICIHCRRLYPKVKSYQRYCGLNCRVNYWNKMHPRLHISGALWDEVDRIGPAPTSPTRKRKRSSR